MISVVIPLYNKEKYIARAIRSVLKQTFQDFEIIIVDDGSTDKSVEEVKKFDTGKIRIISQENAGVSAARNRGIEEARYDLIAFLDADDEWKKDYLRSQHFLVEMFPTCHVFAVSYLVEYKEEQSKPQISSLPFAREGILDYFCIAYKSDPPVWTSAVVVKKDALLDIGGFPVGITSGEDLITWAQLAAQYSVVYSKEIQSIYHVDENIWDAGRPPDENDFVGNELKKLWRNNKSNKCLKKYISFWYKIRASMYMKQGKYFKALRESIKALFYNPYSLKSYQSLFFSLLPYGIVKQLLRYKVGRS